MVAFQKMARNNFCATVVISHIKGSKSLTHIGFQIIRTLFRVYYLAALLNISNLPQPGKNPANLQGFTK